MEVELMKPSTQDQTEMMKTMMQLDLLPQLSMPHTSTSASPEIKFSGGNAATINPTTATPIVFLNPFVTSTTFTDPASSMPIPSTPFQEPMAPPLSTSFRVDSTVGPLSSLTTMGSEKNRLIRHEDSAKLGPLMMDPLHERNSMECMREMIFRMAVMQPIEIDPESVKPVKRRNVKISRDPQSVVARQRREKISERMRILQRLVPGGTKMDTACMLDEAIHYVKFLKKQVQTLEEAGVRRSFGDGVGLNQRRAMLANANQDRLW